jgi:hypothetical protein
MARCGAKVVSGSFDPDLPEPVYRETLYYPTSKSRLHSQRSSCFFETRIDRPSARSNLPVRYLIMKRHRHKSPGQSVGPTLARKAADRISG